MGKAAHERERDRLKAQYLYLLNKIMPRVQSATIGQVREFIGVSEKMHDLDLQYVRRMELALLRNNIEIDSEKRRVQHRKRRIRANTDTRSD